MQGNQKVNVKSVAKYMLLLGIVPRIKEFAGSGFGYLAHLMAHVYSIARLIPAGHPYLSPANVGRFGVRHVIAEAAENVKLKKENIDQVIIFFALLLGFVLLVAQFFLLVGGLIIQPVFAQTTPGFTFVGWFAISDEAAHGDIAFMMLDKVFAIPGMFGSKFAPDASAIPAFNQGLQELFRFYSTAILLVGVIVFLYYIVLIVGESAQSGTPFGQRFNHVWAPLRLVVAIGLLIPMSYGLNTAQYITLYAAKWGSNFATNAWVLYNRSPGMTSVAGLGEDTDAGAGGKGKSSAEKMIAKPSAPDIYPTVQFMNLVLTCSYAYEYSRPDSYAEGAPADGVPPAIKYEASATGVVTEAEDNTLTQGVIQPYLIRSKTNQSSADLSESEKIDVNDADAFGKAKDFTGGTDIIISFGHYDEVMNANVRGYVEPYCGEIRIPTVARGSEAADIIQKAYFDLVLELWKHKPYRSYAKRVVAKELTIDRAPKDGSADEVNINGCDVMYESGFAAGSPEADNDPGVGGFLEGEACKEQEKKPETADGTAQAKGDILPDGAWKMEQYAGMKSALAAKLVGENNSAYTKMNEEFTTNGVYDVPDELLLRGWGGAGIWYNKIAEWNGALFGAVMAGPSVSRMPSIMTRLKKEQEATSGTTTAKTTYSLELSEGKKIAFQSNALEGIAKAMVTTYKDWVLSGQILSIAEQKSGNIIRDLVAGLFGIQSLYTMRDDSQTHPLAQLSALGKGIIDAAVRNFMTSLMFSFGGGMASMADSANLGGMLSSASTMFTAFTTVGLTVGFSLYYMLPFLPFLYFFFAVGYWVKSIFEAMVGVPLWALAHLKVDGNGLPGETAANGYFLIFEIFLRPILCVVGLVGGMGVFVALVRTLNDIFGLVTDNVGGFDCLTDAGSGLCLQNSSASDVSADGTTIVELKNKRNELDEFFFTIIYTIIVYMMATSCFKLIDLIPKQIMRWMGTGVSAFADKSESAGSLMRYATMSSSVIGGQAVQAANSGAAALGNVAGMPLRGIGQGNNPAVGGSGGGSGGGAGGGSGGGAGGGAGGG